MARILLVLFGVMAIGAASAFAWCGLEPPKLQSVQVTHEITVGQLVPQ